MRIPHAFFVYVIAVALTNILYTQPSDYFLSVDYREAKENNPVEITIELLQTGSIHEAMLMYRPFGTLDFIPVEIYITGRLSGVTIPASHATPPFIEYYIKLTTWDGVDHTYPAIDPEYNPEIIPVQYESRLNQTVRILSPQENESLRLEDLVISASFFDLPDIYDRRDIQVHVGNTDVTQHTIITDDILIVVPANVDDLSLSPGRNRIRLSFREYNTGQVHSLSWNFNLIAPRVAEAPIRPDFRYNVTMRGESRNESLAGGSTWYNRSTITFEGELPWVRMRSNLHVTNEERSTRQPQNRYSFSAETPWLRLHAGDTYPRLPSLIMNGRRMRGFFGQLELGWINLDYVTGQTIRRVEGNELYQLSAFEIDTEGNPIPIQPPSNSILINDSTYAVYSFGTHTRNITAIRPSFGSRDLIQMGFSYLHSKDDVTSVEFGRRPAENLVLGSDLRVSLDRRRIEFIGQVAGSLQNIDISRGNLEREELEDLMGRGAVDRLEEIVSLSTLQNFITINQYLVPFDPREFSSLAVDVQMRINYFGNHFQFGYIRRGNDYNSFGLSALRRDIEGFRIRDRLRLMQNQLYFDVSVESLRDNLNDTKAHTTHFNRYDASISYFPRQNLPSVTVGYGHYKNDNRVDPFGPNSTAAILDVTNRFFTQLSHSFFWHIRHTGSLSFNVSLRDDQTARNLDVDVYNIMTMVNSYFSDLPLRTNIGLGVYQSTIPSFDQEANEFTRGNFNYVNLILGGEYRLMENDLILNASFVPTFGDFNRTVFQAGAQYYFMRNLSVIFRADYMVNPNNPNDMISNLTVRYDI